MAVSDSRFKRLSLREPTDHQSIPRLIQDYYRKEKGFECKKTIAVVETKNKRKP
ncbi:hypothetical protein RO3G_17080 [Rhizopus delemar RA 99-880]|uniref:Uncharacterized protein n=1 Tax=Rhizopus delemar (strain RA 99-880 / ATCC MYA-4621 / FGSC 9543 / NRRL 43880) TaxID=246409 RepID=I1CUZ3_RHIO9|nr:hypothetical protein RO3G_17080 [Rhizopus delemar RA 99-880]|eukprot:EIE92273.1 hypothetical protein RO3G_17080 [Rhizopus delemar RA 99-880]